MSTIRSALAIAFAIACLAPATAAAEGKKPDAAKPKSAPQIQLAILLDTSGSMDGLINQARTQLWKIVNELATAKQNGKSPQLQVALYEYGKSSLPKSSGYLRRIVPLTDDLDKISEELFALKTNGGSEYCGMVIQSATRGLKWSKNDKDLKLIFIAGNEPFTQGPVNYKEACSAAIKRGITINTIHCGPRTQGIATGWQHGAQLADGSFSNIDQNRRVATIRTPYDAKLVQLGGRINKTYVAFGAVARRRASAARQIAQDVAAKKAAPASAAGRASFKGKAAYNASAWDLIDAIKNKKIKLADVKPEHLPKAMQKMTLAQKRDYLKKKAAERDKIRKEIKKLSDQRTKYIAEQRKKNAEKSTGDAFGDALLKSIRGQASKKNYKFKK